MSLDQQQRSPATIEKVIVRPNPSQIENLGEDSRNRSLPYQTKTVDSFTVRLHCPIEGAGKAAASSLPFTVSGSSSDRVYDEGLMCAGIFSAKNFPSTLAVSSVPGAATKYAASR